MGLYRNRLSFGRREQPLRHKRLVAGAADQRIPALWALPVRHNNVVSRKFVGALQAMHAQCHLVAWHRAASVIQRRHVYCCSTGRYQNVLPLLCGVLLAVVTPCDAHTPQNFGMVPPNLDARPARGVV